MLETAKILARGNPWAFQVWYAGLTSEERLALKTELAFDAVGKAIESIADILEQLYQAIVEAIQAIVEWAKTFLPILFKFGIHRLMLYRKLVRWHLPHWLAQTLAYRCPQRWLAAVTG